MIRLHHVPFSRSFRVLWMLEELGLAAEIVTYRIEDGSLRAPDFLKVSPTGRVPGLEIDGLALFESGAILEYLAERHPEAGLGCPPGAAERPRYLQAMHFAETMAGQIEQLNMQHLFLRPPAKPAPVVIKLNTARLKGALAALDGMLDGRETLLDQGFSAADVMMGFNLAAAPYYVPRGSFPRLESYFARLEKRPAYVRARAKDGPQTFYRQDFYPVPQEA